MNQIAATVRLLRILYFVFFASVLVYFGIGEFLGARLKPTADVALVRTVFWLIGAGTAVAALVFRYRLMPALPAAPLAEAELAATLERLRMSYLTSFALAESVAILGLVLRLLGGSLNDVLPFLVVAAALFVLFYPRLPDGYLG